MVWLIRVLFPITWLVSDHVILKHNALMLLYLPLDFYFILLGLSLIFRNRIPCRDFYGKYMKLHTITYALLLFGFITGIIKQDVSRSLYFVCPGFIISLFLLYINERDKGSQYFLYKLLCRELCLKECKLLIIFNRRNDYHLTV